MEIKSREVVIKVVDEINLTPEQWDSQAFRKGTVGWRLHMSKILNLRVTKLAPQCQDAVSFYNLLERFSREIGFGEVDVIAQITEHVYNCKLQFNSEQEAA